MSSLPRYESGFTVLYRGIKAYFQSQLYSAAIHAGIRAYFEQWNQGPGGGDRVVLIPGEFHGETQYRARPYGTLQPKLQHQSLNPREVAQWTRPVTISVWARPSDSAPADEIDQNERTEALFEAVRVAGQVTQAADIKWSDVERVAPPQERQFGEAILIHLVQRGPLYYPTDAVVYPTAAVARSA